LKPEKDREVHITCSSTARRHSYFLAYFIQITRIGERRKRRKDRGKQKEKSKSCVSRGWLGQSSFSLVVAGKPQEGRQKKAKMNCSLSGSRTPLLRVLFFMRGEHLSRWTNKDLMTMDRQ